jgi:phosphoserine phosphatase RsbU/P
MVAAVEPLREQLIDRRQRLEVAVASFQQAPELTRLLQEVDAALRRMDDGSYGLCEVCHEPIERDRLIADPLTCFCLGDLTPGQQRELEDDLQLASRIQTGLLPDLNKKVDGWEIACHYQPAGLVSGDYCDLIETENHDLYFIVGDVSGKGVAASMLMAHLHAMFRTLVSINLPLNQLVERASRVFCESTLPTHYATLVCGKAEKSGAVEICNAGHPPPLLVREREVTSIDSTGLPIGIFCSEQFSFSRFQMQKGDTLFLYSDGLTEALDGKGGEYGNERLSILLIGNHNQSPRSLVESCVRDLANFCERKLLSDDLTMMAIHRAA